MGTDLLKLQRHLFLNVMTAVNLAFPAAAVAPRAHHHALGHTHVRSGGSHHPAPHSNSHAVVAG